MGIYTCIMAIFVPALLNIILNTLIFSYVRSSTRRIQPQSNNASTSGPNNQQPRMSRRDMSLLKQMLVMFSMFIGGWTPILIVYTMNIAIDVDIKIIKITVLFSEVCIFGIVMNLYIYNHELRHYLLNKIRLLFQR
ncbi:unnamed protein product [Adineta steineri]|uniref:G-protein coupled receptors family 1 profile domain-containing protein n=1 Tax=Adineta steineri TaxID=433720 RepID=A0A818M4X9_9BILA|nr:unnamed protein product [Adineta steineri]CAF3586867.1 unnamed protein product [Adineta steineri]